MYMYRFPYISFIGLSVKSTELSHVPVPHANQIGQSIECKIVLHKFLPLDNNNIQLVWDKKMPNVHVLPQTDHDHNMGQFKYDTLRTDHNLGQVNMVSQNWSLSGPVT